MCVSGVLLVTSWYVLRISKMFLLLPLKCEGAANETSDTVLGDYIQINIITSVINRLPHFILWYISASSTSFKVGRGL